MSSKKHLPNFLTSFNLLCGCVGVVQVFQGEIVLASYLIWLAALFDFLDGFIARAVGAFSEIGKQLDSLADMVTFGLLPSMIMFALISQSTSSVILPYFAFLIAVFSALRLAKFNIDTRQTTSFIGLPTPANAIFISSLPIIISMNYFGLAGIILEPFFLMGITLLFSYLLIAELEMFSLKFKNFSWESNKITFVFLVSALVLFIIFRFLAIPLIIVLYILLSIGFAIKSKI